MYIGGHRIDLFEGSNWIRDMSLARSSRVGGLVTLYRPPRGQEEVE